MTMPRSYAALTALVLILLAGLVHGLWADRWGTAPELAAAAVRLSGIPMRFGDWEGKDMPVDAESFAMAGPTSYLSRLYTHRRTKASALVILMCGRAGKMVVHTPEVCYPGAGFELLDAPYPWPVRAAGGEELGTFWTARFGKAGAGSANLRLIWGWSPGDSWQAPASPRWHFRSAPFLYKFYVSLDAPETEKSAAEDTAAEFLRRFLPEARKALFVQNPH